MLVYNVVGFHVIMVGWFGVLKVVGGGLGRNNPYIGSLEACV